MKKGNPLPPQCAVSPYRPDEKLMPPRRRHLFFSAILCMLFALPGAWGAKQKGFSVLVIGDSNTEHGFITLPLADTLYKYLGVATMGSGYIPFDSGFYAIENKRYGNITIAYDTVMWKLMDMFEWNRLPPPYQSPNGQWLKSSTKGAKAMVTFLGNGVDLYWLADSLGGAFTIAIDDTIRDTVTTTGKKAVCKTAVSGLTSARHTMKLMVTGIVGGGNVTLLGFDARNDFGGEPIRSVVHNWGNGWSSTKDFLGIDSIVFSTGLRALSPEVVVVLLGTNDHLQDSRNAVDFKTNLIAIIKRIQASGIDTRILLVSTFMTNNTSGATFLPQYRATSWPEAAAATGVQYWDMSGWFGQWKGALMMDENHCNESGGRKIAFEMFNQILQRFYSPSASDPPIRSLSIDGPVLRVQNGRLTVRADAGVAYEVQILSSSGAVVARLAGSGSCSYSVHNILVSPGVYLLRALMGNKRLTVQAQLLW